MTTPHMKNQPCRECNKNTWHNPCPRPATKSWDWRCVECGQPRRPGQKNYGIRKGGKIIMEAKP